jgi:hypothetical protein
MQDGIVREPSVSTFDQAGRLRALAAYWRDQSSDGSLPGQTAIDPQAMRAWLGHLLLVDVIAGGEEFVYRVYGSGVADTFGRDMTGHSPREFPAHHVDIIQGPYRDAVAGRVPRFTAHILSIRERKFAAWERVILPIANLSGTVDQLLIGIYRVRIADYRGYCASLEAEGIVPAVTEEADGAFL